MATGYYPASCVTEVGEHSCDACPTNEHGRIRGVGFIHSSYYSTIAADPLNSSLWTTGLDAGAAGIINLPETEGEMATPSPVTRTGFGDTSEFLIGFDFEVTFRDPNYIDNCDFWNSLNNARGLYYFYYRTETQTYISDKPVTIVAAPQIENDDQSLVLWNVSAKWRSLNVPCNYTTIPILRTCWVNN